MSLEPFLPYSLDYYLTSLWAFLSDPQVAFPLATVPLVAWYAAWSVLFAFNRK